MPESTSTASWTSRAFPMWVPRGISILVISAATFLPQALPISTMAWARARPSASVFIKAPEPHFTSRTMLRAPAASFLDITDDAIKGRESTVAVTSRRA